jgi:hypothetical protein
MHTRWRPPPGTCDPASSRPRVIHHKSPHDMPCSRRSPFKPHAGASTSMWDSSRVCRSRTMPCTKRYSATRSYRPRLSARRVDMVAALPATIPCLVRHFPCRQYCPFGRRRGPRDADLRAWHCWLWSWVVLLRVGLENRVLAQLPTFGKVLVVCQYSNARKERNAAYPNHSLR